MVRMLYQNGDKVLNTVNENNEPFYMQLEALMRRESNEKKIQLHENGHIGGYLFLLMYLDIQYSVQLFRFKCYRSSCFTRICRDIIVPIFLFFFFFLVWR